LIPSQPPGGSLHAQQHGAIAANTSREHRQGEGVVISLDAAKERIRAPLSGSDKFGLTNDDHGQSPVELAAAIILRSDVALLSQDRPRSDRSGLSYVSFK
jgi:hypothetical protein